MIDRNHDIYVQILQYFIPIGFNIYFFWIVLSYRYKLLEEKIKKEEEEEAARVLEPLVNGNEEQPAPLQTDQQEGNGHQEQHSIIQETSNL